jgi:hypothetical protein
MAVKKPNPETQERLYHNQIRELAFANWEGKGDWSPTGKEKHANTRMVLAGLTPFSVVSEEGTEIGEATIVIGPYKFDVTLRRKEDHYVEIALPRYAELQLTPYGECAAEWWAEEIERLVYNGLASLPFDPRFWHYKVPRQEAETEASEQ